MAHWTMHMNGCDNEQFRCRSRRLGSRLLINSGQWHYGAGYTQPYWCVSFRRKLVKASLTPCSGALDCWRRSWNPSILVRRRSPWLQSFELAGFWDFEQCRFTDRHHLYIRSYEAASRVISVAVPNPLVLASISSRRWQCSKSLNYG